MKMIQLEIWDGNSIYINPDYIATLYTESINSKIFTRVGTVGITVGKEVLVKETPEEILNLIKNAK